MIKHPDMLRAASHTRAGSCIPGEVGCWLRLYRAYAYSAHSRYLARNIQRTGWRPLAEPLTAQETTMKPDCSIRPSVMVGIIKALKGQNRAHLIAALHRHLSVCKSCRARLLLYVCSLDPRIYRQRASYSCEQCQIDLPTFIDLELDSPAQAATTYPQLCWHLRLCQICEQTYTCTHKLLAAEGSGCLAPPCLLARAAPPPVPIVGRVRLTRQLLVLTIPRSVAMVSDTPDEDYSSPPHI